MCFTVEVLCIHLPFFIASRWVEQCCPAQRQENPYRWLPCPTNIQIMNKEPAVQYSATQQFVASSSLHEFQHRLQFRVASADDNTSYSPFRKKDRRDCPPLRGGNDFFSCPTNVSHRTLSVPPSSFTFLRQVSR